MDITMKELRKRCGLTQSDASALTGIPLRTYKVYENDASKEGSIKYNYIIQKLKEYGRIDESHGILKHEDIVSACADVFGEYDVHYCYLFGSYAKGTATEVSDVDLMISTSVSGLRYYGLAEKLREKLKKNVDLINMDQLLDNRDLLNDILKDGEKIYEQG